MLFKNLYAIKEPLERISFNFDFYFSVYSSLYLPFDDVTLAVSCINKRDARS